MCKNPHIPNDKLSPYQWATILEIGIFCQFFQLTSYNVIY
jgi:hypothetical protein